MAIKDYRDVLQANSVLQAAFPMAMISLFCGLACFGPPLGILAESLLGMGLIAGCILSIGALLLTSGGRTTYRAMREARRRIARGEMDAIRRLERAASRNYCLRVGIRWAAMKFELEDILDREVLRHSWFGLRLPRAFKHHRA